MPETIFPKLIAFHLTQFYPTPENNEWWGKGFTEWTNVTKSTPLFDGHYQPRLPSDFGFYDLRLKESRLDQISLAKQYGIDGFCYHYYWFSGKRILNVPLDAMLSDPDHDMPFCLCWANENWTRRWDAADHQVLIAQKYLEDDDLNFIKSLIPFFQDPRYIRLDGKPFLIVYRPQHLPNAKETLSIWRRYCISVGIGDIYLSAALSHGNTDYAQYGFDAGVEFPPHNLKTTNVNGELDFYQPFVGNVMQYSDIAKSYINRTYGSGCSNVFRTVFPSWDNTARTGPRALITLNGTPANYEFWLQQAVLSTQRDFPKQERFVFINAWNEWAEGCHLEPDRCYGRAFLEATERVKLNVSQVLDFADLELPKSSSLKNGGFGKELCALCTRYCFLYVASLKNFINSRPKLRNAMYPLWSFYKFIVSSKKK